MKKWKLGLSSVILVGLLAACGDDETIETNADTNVGSDNNAGQTEIAKDAKVLKFAFSAAEDAFKPFYEVEQIIESKTNGAIDVQFYPGGQLGGDVQALEGVRSGTIEASAMSTTIIASLNPEFNIYDVPFLFKSSDVAYEIMDGEIGDKLSESLEQYDLVGLGYLDATYRNLTNNKKEVRTPDDLKGLNVRTLENALQVKFWKELGANPTAISFSELYSALESNVVEGQENPFNVINSSKFFEVQKFMTRTEHLLMPRFVVVSDKFWNSLTPEEQTIVQEAIKVGSDNMRAESLNQQDAAIANIEANGVKITELSDEDRQLWIDKAAPVYDEFKKVIGEELYNQVIELAK
jgi:TRAP-type transport system periplasmic protein